LDFSDVARVDIHGLAAIEELAAKTGKKSLRVTLRAVNVAIYKVLKLSRLSSRFSFSN